MKNAVNTYPYRLPNRIGTFSGRRRAQPIRHTDLVLDCAYCGVVSESCCHTPKLVSALLLGIGMREMSALQVLGVL